MSHSVAELVDIYSKSSGIRLTSRTSDLPTAAYADFPSGKVEARESDVPLTLPTRLSEMQLLKYANCTEYIQQSTKVIRETIPLGTQLNET